MTQNDHIAKSHSNTYYWTIEAELYLKSRWRCRRKLQEADEGVLLEEARAHACLAATSGHGQCLRHSQRHSHPQRSNKRWAQGFRALGSCKLNCSYPDHKSTNIIPGWCLCLGEFVRPTIIPLQCLPFARYPPHLIMGFHLTTVWGFIFLWGTCYFGGTIPACYIPPEKTLWYRTKADRVKYMGILPMLVWSDLLSYIIGLS